MNENKQSSKGKTLLTVKTDKQLKEDAQRTADLLGLPLGTVINALLLQFVRDQSITLTFNSQLKQVVE